jgi:hypothetical protein
LVRNSICLPTRSRLSQWGSPEGRMLGIWLSSQFVLLLACFVTISFFSLVFRILLLHSIILFSPSYFLHLIFVLLSINVTFIFIFYYSSTCFGLTRPSSGVIVYSPEAGALLCQFFAYVRVPAMW